MKKYFAFAVMTLMLAIAGMGVSFGTQNNIFLPFLSFPVGGASYQASGHLDATGNILGAQGSLSALAVSGVAAVIKATPGRVVRVNVTTAGSAAGSLNDAATTGAAGATNLIFSIPNTVGTYYLDWPAASGIVVTPGTGQIMSISYQ